MSAFLTELDVRRVTNRCWCLLAPLGYTSDGLGQTLRIGAGFETNFASIPPWVPSGFAVAQPAAVLHDFLYGAQLVPRLQADRLLREAMLVLEEPAWVAALFYRSVRLWGGGHWPTAPQFARLLNPYPIAYALTP